MQIKEYYYQILFQRDFTERDFTERLYRERFYRDFISYTERNFMKREVL